jgi:hypothetical protein
MVKQRAVFGVWAIISFVLAFTACGGAGPSNDASLKNLTVSEGELNPAFSPSVLSYTVLVPDTVESVSIEAVATHRGAAISPENLTGIPLDNETNPITVTVTAEDGTSRDYTVTVTRVGGAGLAASGTSLSEQLEWLKGNAVSGIQYSVTVSESEDIGLQTLSFKGKNNVTVRLVSDGEERIISYDADWWQRTGQLFTVESGVTLILDNGITLKGILSNFGPVVKVNGGGRLIMKEGAKITGNTSGSSPAGVSVEENAAFTMSGGEISGNSVTTNQYNSSGFYGGGVCVKENATFTMSGGKISGNSVKVITLSGNICGGWVYIAQNATFTMSGGEISDNNTSDPNNHSGYGGGVYINNGTFILEGGSICDNKAQYGGGVFVDLGTFTMTSGQIRSNTAASTGSSDVGNSYTACGGGVYTNGTFKMTGGFISGNKVSSVSQSGFGGGVYVNKTFIMSGGEISGNTAVSTFTSTSDSARGGGVYTSSFGDFTMTDGSILGNTATGFLTYGGGVYITASSLFTKSGGTITGYADDPKNGNKVTNRDGDVVSSDWGHAMYFSIQTPHTGLNKEVTVGPEDNFNGKWL